MDFSKTERDLMFDSYMASVQKIEVKIEEETKKHLQNQTTIRFWQIRKLKAEGKRYSLALNPLLDEYNQLLRKAKEVVLSD